MRANGSHRVRGNSPCIDDAVDAYLEEGTLPAAGTVCRQQVPFAGRTGVRHWVAASPSGRWCDRT